MWPFKKEFNPGDPNDLFRELAALRQENRTNMDRYREWRAVFGTEQGKRVLDDILAFCHMGHSSIKPGGPIDPYAVLANEGERRLGLKISTTYSAEPTAQPTKQHR